jgi:thiol peroxidase
MIKKLRLLTRAVLVIDKNNAIKYLEIVPEITNHPDYDKALAAI